MLQLRHDICLRSWSLKRQWRGKCFVQNITVLPVHIACTVSLQSFLNHCQQKHTHFSSYSLINVFNSILFMLDLYNLSIIFEFFYVILFELNRSEGTICYVATMFYIFIFRMFYCYLTILQISKIRTFYFFEIFENCKEKIVKRQS